MSDQKPLTMSAEREAEIFRCTYLTPYNMWEVKNELDAERAARAETREQLKEARKIIEVYFSPWGAAKAALWEELSNDGRFDAETGMNLIRKAIGIPPADAASQPSSPEANAKS